MRTEREHAAAIRLARNDEALLVAQFLRTLGRAAGPAEMKISYLLAARFVAQYKHRPTRSKKRS